MDLLSSERAQPTAAAAGPRPGCAVLEERPPSRAPYEFGDLSARDLALTAPGRWGRGWQWLADCFGLTGNDDPKQSPWRVLGHPQMKRYFLGSVASDFGSWIQNTAQVLLAYKLTHSVFAVGLVTCAQFASPLVLGPWAGVAADRFGSTRTLIGTQALSALIAATLGIMQFTGLLTEPVLIAGAVAIGLCFTFALPARTVTVRRLVPEDKIKAAMAMDSVSYNLGRALAPVLSVVVIATIGFGWAFEINAISFIVFSIVLLGLPNRPAESAQQSSPVLSGFKIGFQVAWNRRKIMILLLMVASVTVAADPILVLGPALAKHVFHASADWSALFIGALGAGSVVGSVLPRQGRPSIRRAAVVVGLLGLAMVIFAAAPRVWISVIAAFIAGVACLVANSATRALLIEHAGRQYEVSVMAMWAIAWAGSKPIASLVDGSLAGTTIGVRGAGIVLALPALLPALALLCWPAVSKRGVRQAAYGQAR
ncbi:MAG TPA: MFS transporter [Streptosporangiaceae bacterium]|nr:MFS transporter [Streptosporangiaceae bacterium]